MECIQPTLRRAATCLYPATGPTDFDKAWASAADAIILDLEDAVAPDRKSQARDAVRGWLARERPVWVRTNPADTPWFEEDLELLRDAGVAGIESPRDSWRPVGSSQATTVVT